MKRSWIKLYVEIVDDPKMGRLSDGHWRIAIELFLLAGESGQDGLLPPMADMAWKLRRSVEELTDALHALSLVGIVDETPQGWNVTHFKDRQFSESFERVKRFRNANVTESNADGNAVVAENESSSPSSSSSPSESEGGGVGEGIVFSAYEKNVGALTPIIADGLKADIDDYSQDWVLAAIEYAARQEKRSLAYVEGVLKGWKRDGLTDPRKQAVKSKNGAKNANEANRKSNSIARNAGDPEQDKRDRATADLIKASRAAKVSMP